VSLVSVSFAVHYRHDLSSLRITLVLGRIANSSATGCNLGTLASENRNPTSVGAASRVPRAMRLYYRGCRRTGKPDLPSVYRPRWSSMPVCVSCQLIYLYTRSGFTMYSSFFSVSCFASSFTIVTFSSLSLSVSWLFYPKEKERHRLGR